MFGRLLGLVSFSAIAALALAGPQTFAQRVQNIRAGIVILDSAKTTGLNAQPQSAGPYALYNLDSNTTVKPAGWSFSNPNGPSRVTPTIYNRWSLIDTNTPAVGTRLGKRNAPYWEVILSQVSDAVLANYDLLLVNPTLYAQLTPIEQNKLRRFVDNGGVLWIDPAGLSSSGGIDQLNNFPLPFSFNSPASGVQQTDFTSYLMNSIQTLTASDVNVLDAASPSSYFLTNVSLSAIGTELGGATATDFSRLKAVSDVGGSPTIMMGQIGEGIVVITANGASIKLNRSQESTSYLANNGYTALDPYLEQDGLAAAKLAINMVGLLRESRQQGSSSRKVSSSPIDLVPPLIQRSSIADGNYGSNATASGANYVTPALYKGLLVTTVNGFFEGLRCQSDRRSGWRRKH